MNSDDVTRWAREAGMHRQQHNLMSNPVQHRYSYDGYEENLERFAQAAYAAGAAAEQEKFAADLIEYGKAMAAVEREACARVCEENADDLSEGDWDYACINCAAAIRARNKS